MNKTQFIAAVNKKAGAKGADLYVNAAIAVIEESLKKGEKIQITGFGTFESASAKQEQARTRARAKP